jgi:hypothetical protein
LSGHRTAVIQPPLWTQAPPGCARDLSRIGAPVQGFTANYVRSRAGSVTVIDPLYRSAFASAAVSSCVAQRRVDEAFVVPALHRRGRRVVEGEAAAVEEPVELAGLGEEFDERGRGLQARVHASIFAPSTA